MATPETAVTVVVPDRTPPAGLVSMAIVTAPLNVETVAPPVSTARTVTAGVIAVPACVSVGCCPNTSRTVVGGTNVNVTVAVSEIAAPPTVPRTVAVAGDDGAVNSALYVPLPASVTGPRVPAVVVSATTAPPDVRGLPAASRSSTVIVDELDPSAGTEVGEAVIIDVVAEAGPGVMAKGTLVAPVIPLAAAVKV